MSSLFHTPKESSKNKFETWITGIYKTSWQNNLKEIKMTK